MGWGEDVLATVPLGVSTRAKGESIVRKVIIIGAATIIALMSLPAFATNPGNNGGGNGGCGVGQQTNGCGGAGGAGGNATAAAAAAASAQAAAIASQQQIQQQGQGQSQSSRTSNRNTANGGNASSDQSQEVNNSGAGSNSNNYNAPAIPVSSAVAPSFAIGGCQWAFSGGLQLFGAGVSGGSAGMYEFCKALMKSKHMHEVGNRDVAKALECQDSSIRAAYKTAGQPCLEDMPRQVAAVTPIVPVPVNVVSRRAEFPAGETGTVQCLNTYGVKACN
jgi:hypothetical protein